MTLNLGSEALAGQCCMVEKGEEVAGMETRPTLSHRCAGGKTTIKT
jgi:hypothetical protein